MNRQDRRKRAREDSRKAVALRRALEQSSSTPEAVLAASHRLFELGRARDALPALRRACKQNSEHARLRTALAYALAASGKLNAAAAEYRTLLQRDPNSAPLLTNLAVLLMNLPGREQEALDLLSRAAEAAPDHANTVYTLAELYERQGRRAETFHHYRKAVTLLRRRVGSRPEPERCNDLVKLATALLWTGEPAAALAAFDRAIELRPDHALALARRGLALSRLRRIPEAIESFRRAAAAEPDYAEVRRAMGDLLLEAGERKAAESAYRAALKINPRDALANYFLAASRQSQTLEAPPAGYVEKLFDEYADAFDKHLVEILQYRGPELLCEAVGRVAQPPTAAWVIADLGCGTGLCGPLVHPYARRLIGVDLSAAMLAKARERGVYDELLQGDIAAALARFEAEIDLALSADVVVYLGSLTAVFAAVARALRPGGWLGFTAETHDGDGFLLDTTGRYRHSRHYLDAEAAAQGLAVAHAETIIGRYQSGQPVHQHLLILRRPA